jgi:hypothetical protein
MRPIRAPGACQAQRDALRRPFAAARGANAAARRVAAPRRRALEVRASARRGGRGRRAAQRREGGRPAACLVHTPHNLPCSPAVLGRGQGARALHSPQGGARRVRRRVARAAETGNLLRRPGSRMWAAAFLSRGQLSAPQRAPRAGQLWPAAARRRGRCGAGGVERGPRPAAAVERRPRVDGGGGAGSGQHGRVQGWDGGRSADMEQKGGTQAQRAQRACRCFAARASKTFPPPVVCLSRQLVCVGGGSAAWEGGSNRRIEVRFGLLHAPAGVACLLLHRCPGVAGGMLGMLGTCAVEFRVPHPNCGSENPRLLPGSSHAQVPGSGPAVEVACSWGRTAEAAASAAFAGGGFDAERSGASPYGTALSDSDEVGRASTARGRARRLCGAPAGRCQGHRRWSVGLVGR